MIKAKYTKKNFLHYGKQYEWAILFQDAGLSDLPDPDGEYDVEALENWLIASLVHRGMDEKQARQTVQRQGGRIPA